MKSIAKSRLPWNTFELKKEMTNERKDDRVTMKKTLRELFGEKRVVLAPEVYDCASALTCMECGYKAPVLSGAEASLAH